MVKESIGTLRNVKKWFNNVPPPRPLMHEYTIMKWLAGLPPLFASSSPLTSPHSFTRVCFFTLSPTAAFSLFHSRLLFCFFTRSWNFAFSPSPQLLFCFPAVIIAWASTICALVLQPQGWANRTEQEFYKWWMNPLSIQYDNSDNFNVRMIHCC